MRPTISIKGAWATLAGTSIKVLEDCLVVLDPKRYFNRAYRDKRWDGKVRLFNGRRFPSGLTQHVVDHINSEGHDVKVVGREEKVPVDTSRFDKTYLGGIGPDNDDLIPEQCEAILAMLAKKRGIIKSPTGCHRRGQLVMMYGGSLRRVQDVKVGERLMGPDSQPRRVLQLCRGRGQMFCVQPKKGNAFVVNGDHVLSLVRVQAAKYRGKRKDQKAGQIVDVTVRDWMEWPKTQKHIHKLFRAPVEFPHAVTPVLNPYLLGVLLGDGTLTQRRAAVTTEDAEIVEELEDQALRLGLTLSLEGGPERTATYHLVGERGIQNPLHTILHSYGLMDCRSGTKFIPDEFKRAPRGDRLSLLAGLMDTDGSLASGYFDYLTKSERLADDVVFVARSVGLAAYVKPCRKGNQYGFEGLYYRVGISGCIDMIPCHVLRKQAATRRQKKSVLRTGFEIKLWGTEDYYGFVLDGDHRYLMGDFTVTHNSGKTEMVAVVARYLWEERGWRSLIVVPRKGLAKQTANRLRSYYNGDLTVGQCGDGMKEIGDVTVATAQTLIGFRPRKRKGRTIAPDPELMKLVNDWEVLFLDEAHHASSTTWYDIAMYSGAIRRYGLSGTPLKNNEISDMKLIGATGPIIYEVEAETLIDAGFTAQPKIVMVIHANASRMDLPVEIGQRIGKNGRPYQVVKELPYKEAYPQAIVESIEHNTAVVRATRWLVDQGRKVLVICRRKDHWISLSKMLDEVIPYFDAVWGATDTETRDQAKKTFINLDHGAALLATTIFDEGEDVPNIDAIVLAEGVKVSTNALQRVGRGMRRKKGTNDVWVVDIVPMGHKKLMGHALERAKAYEREGYPVLPLEKWPDKDVPLDDNPPDLLPFVRWDAAVEEELA